MAKMYTMDDAPVVRTVRRHVGAISEDEAALVRTLTPARLDILAEAEHLLDLADLISTIRGDEAMRDYVFAIAPMWDGSIETLVLGGRVTNAFTRFELSRVA